MNVPFPAPTSFSPEKSQGVSVLLGPTNTGKTHYAIERMLSHHSGMIGLPLRLLAREVYNRAVEKAGVEAVALITGEEKIKPESPRYWVSTVEAMPRDLNVSFVAVDEIQLAADLDRGHVFTDRLLHLRGREETLLIGAATMHQAVRGLLPAARISARPRLSKLSFGGAKKITRLPRRSAIVAFSAEDVYAIAEWIRRQCGGAAVVLGALSPRTRNAQVDMFQNGLVDYIVATDAIGMGLNLDVDHIAFAGDRKFDGWQHRRLNPAELGQIAGRAGRHLRDGSFGTTGRCPPFGEELIEQLEDHRFDPVRMLQWRNSDLDFSSIAGLIASLDKLPGAPGLTRAPQAADQLALEFAARDEKVIREAKTRADIGRLWECCQIPDYRKLSPAAHAELVISIFGFVVRAGHIPDDWFARHVAAQDRTDGGLDTLSARIAEIRTWTYIANRTGWLRDPKHWQSVTRQVEDNLSDALHERLAQRFVDRRTSVLMRRLRENAMLEAEVTPSGDVLVAGQHVGQLNGFRFTADPAAVGEAARALNAAAQKALASEIEGRAVRVSEAVDEAFILTNDGIIRWLGEPIGMIAAGAHVLEPRVTLLADEQLTGQALEMVQRRLDLWLAQHVKKLLGPLIELEKSEGLEGIARGIAFHVAESLGVLDRVRVADEVKGLSQDARAGLRKFGVRFGAYHLYLPGSIKPAPRALAAQLYALKHGEGDALKGLDEVLHFAASGRTSLVADKDVQKNLYRAAGFRVCGDRAVRVDILERLADLIRPAVTYRPGISVGEPPAGAADGEGFVVTVAMTSLAGCSGESFASILRSLGYTAELRKGPAITVPLLSTAEAVPCVPQPTTAGPVPGTEDAAPGDETQPSAEPEALSEPEAVAQSEGPVPMGTPEAVAGDVSTSEASEVPAPPELTGEAASIETPAPEEILIEVWRPHRQQPHRRPEPRPHKKTFVRRGGGTPAGAAAGPGMAAAVTPRDEMAAGELSSSVETPKEAREDHQGGPPPSALKHWQKRGHDRGSGDQRPRFSGQRRPSTAAEPIRGKSDERKTGRGERFDIREKRSAERPPDPNSPFAKLLALKAQLEEQTKPEKDKQDS
ncbi:helicase-related protein [Methylocapsa sp. D3K7]|uniref:helicase-related protein n=1 Tax=Methylocapsa sp. D3K7 TaxID=3041435 RepID=UPI00244E82A9|nr:helicase-related protein [Methylocapsa sp. D3K7]WGJ14601.1 helicase-related protein [Methylocapsa sp. D3K7]